MRASPQSQLTAGQLKLWSKAEHLLDHEITIFIPKSVEEHCSVSIMLHYADADTLLGKCQHRLCIVDIFQWCSWVYYSGKLGKRLQKKNFRSQNVMFLVRFHKKNPKSQQLVIKISITDLTKRNRQICMVQISAFAWVNQHNWSIQRRKTIRRLYLIEHLMNISTALKNFKKN